MTPKTNIQFRVPGKPIAKERARAGRTHFYTPDATRAYEALVRSMAMTEMLMVERLIGTDVFPLDCPLWLTVMVFVQKPKKPRFADLPATRPDVDNYVKAIMDGLGKARAYVDDARVVELHASKRWSKDGFVGCEVTLRRFPG